MDCDAGSRAAPASSQVPPPSPCAACDPPVAACSIPSRRVELQTSVPGAVATRPSCHPGKNLHPHQRRRLNVAKNPSLPMQIYFCRRAATLLGSSFFRRASSGTNGENGGSGENRGHSGFPIIFRSSQFHPVKDAPGQRPFHQEDMICWL